MILTVMGYFSDLFFIFHEYKFKTKFFILLWPGLTFHSSHRCTTCVFTITIGSMILTSLINRCYLKSCMFVCICIYPYICIYCVYVYIYYASKFIYLLVLKCILFKLINYCIMCVVPIL